MIQYRRIFRMPNPEDFASAGVNFKRTERCCFQKTANLFEHVESVAAPKVSRKAGS